MTYGRTAYSRSARKENIKNNDFSAAPFKYYNTVLRARDGTPRLKPNSSTFLAALNPRNVHGNRNTSAEAAPATGSPYQNTENSVATDFRGDESILSDYSSGSEIVIGFAAGSRYADVAALRGSADTNASSDAEINSETHPEVCATISSIPSRDNTCEQASSSDFRLADFSG